MLFRFSELIHQLSTGLLDQSSFTVEVEVLISFRHLVIQKQHKKPRVEAFNFIIVLH